MVLLAMPVRSFAVYWADKTAGISDDKRPKSASTHVRRITASSRGSGMIDSEKQPALWG